jgi:Transcriptional regulator, AbiEi antitoxin
LRDEGLIAAQIARIADRQFGHVTREQLLQLGVPKRTVTRWARVGRLIRVHAGVYAVGHQQRTAIATAMAAVLACGPDAVLSHDSAAALWGVRTWPSVPEVTAPHDRRRRGIRAHRTETLLRKDIRRQSNIRVTSPSRTILDIQSRLTDRQLIRAVNDLRLNKHLRATELERLLRTSPRVHRLIDPQQNPTRSPGEDAFLEFCSTHRLPIPRVNIKLFGDERDAVFEVEKVIVEIDGWPFHRDRQSFESDRERDTVAAEHGYLTVRLTWKRLTGPGAAREAARLRRILEHRRREAA